MPETTPPPHSSSKSSFKGFGSFFQKKPQSSASLLSSPDASLDRKAFNKNLNDKLASSSSEGSIKDPTKGSNGGNSNGMVRPSSPDSRRVSHYTPSGTTTTTTTTTLNLIIIQM